MQAFLGVFFGEIFSESFLEVFRENKEVLSARSSEEVDGILIYWAMSN